jgi:hypothetical protein
MPRDRSNESHLPRSSAPLRLALATCLAMGATQGVLAQTYVFNSVVYPGAVNTDVRGLNNAGDIAGVAVVPDPAGGFRRFGFIYSSTDGQYRELPFTQDAGGVWHLPLAQAINDAGEIAGVAPGADGSRVGFLLTAAGFRFFSYPTRAVTEARGINNQGIVTGIASGSKDGGPAEQVGFLYDPASGQFTEVSEPFSDVIAHGINTAGQVVGNINAWAFVRDPASGALDFFQVDALRTRARGINDNGQVAGFVLSGADVLTFVGTAAGYQTMQFKSADGALAYTTFGEALNNNGVISGLYVDAANVTRGFIATPAFLPTGMTSGGSYTFTVQVGANTPVWVDPPVSLGFEYETGVGNPAFATVRLPIGIGDNQFTLVVGGKQFALPAGQLFDFRTHGFPNGVARFRVTDIEESAGLDPANPQAFPTELTFTASGLFTGSMTALCLNHPLPANATQAMRRALTGCRY